MWSKYNTMQTTITSITNHAKKQNKPTLFKKVPVLLIKESLIDLKDIIDSYRIFADDPNIEFFHDLKSHFAYRHCVSIAEIKISNIITANVITKLRRPKITSNG
jgi:hypothetical protein